MRIEQLQYFNAVTRHGSLRRASEELHLSQPALSESIRSLERELGVRLLDRHRTGAKISRQGEQLLPRINEVIAAVAELRAAADHSDGAVRHVRVGTVNAGTSSLLVPAIQALAEANSATRVELMNVLQVHIHRGVVDGTLDVGLVNVLAGDDLPREVSAVRLLRGRPVAVLRSDHPLAKADAVALDELRSQPFVTMRPGYLMHRFAEGLFGDDGPVESAATDGAENAKFLVASGAGFTILPDYSVLGDPLETAGALTARPIIGVDATVTMLALRKRDGRRNRSVDDFVNVLRDLAARHPQGVAAI